MTNGIEQEKEALRQELRKMMAQGVPQEEIIAHRDAKLSELQGKQTAVQPGATAQQGDGITEDSGSNLAPGSSESNIDPYTGDKLDVDPETQKALKNPKDIGAWENFKNNVSNVMTRIYGFDNRLDLVTADVYEKLLGKEAADKMWAAMPAYDPETGEWIESTDELRANAYRELAETQAAQKQTIGLIDAWEEGSPTKIISAAAGAGLNMVSTLITSGLTLGAGLYTDMVGDAIYDANTEKAKANGMTVQELYDSGGQEFETPAMVGIAGGMLERLGSKGVSRYIGGVSGKLAGKAGKRAVTMINNMGKEGLTEWLQTGLETYNREFGKGNEDAPGVALDTMFSREGLEAALQGAIGAGVGGGAGKGARHFVNKAAERAGVLPKGETPTADMAEAADDSDYLFDAKDNETFYKSQVQSVEEAKATLEQDFDETTPEQRDEARGVIQEAEAAKRAEETKKRYTRQMVQEFNEEYDGTVENPTEEGRIAYVARKLGEVEGVDTFDEALAMTKAKNRDALKVVSKAFISARTPQEAQLVDDINENLVNAKKALETAPPGPTADALGDLVNDYTADLSNLYATANRKVLFADPVAVADAIEASDEIASLTEQETAIEAATELTPEVKGKLLSNIEDKRAQAIEKGEVARQKIEESSSKNVEGTNTEAKYIDEVLKEEAIENTKSTDAIIGEALGLNLFEDPDAQPVIDETLAKSRQPIDIVDGVRHYGKRLGGSFPTRAEALQSGKQTELAAKQKGLKTDITYTDINPGTPGGETTVEIEMYKPREQDLTEAVNNLKNQEQEAEGVVEEGAPVEEAAETVQEEERTATDYVKDFAPEAKETALGDGSIFLPGEDAKAAGAYRAVGGLKKRGHKDAKFEQIGGGFLVRPGERETGEQIEYSIDEAGRAHEADGKFAPKSQGTEVARVKALPLEAEDGATFNLDGTVYEGGGLVVPIASKNMKASELTNEAIENFKTKYKDYMGPASKVGIYKFPDQDQVSIDLNVIAPSEMRDQALKIGRSLGQESLFDLDTFENIKTGQTGANPKTPTAAQAKNISNRLAGQTDRAGGVNLSELGIDEADVINPAKKGESYIKVPFERKGAVVAADKSIGGKGGFASAGDAREAITTSGAAKSATDFMKGIESAWAQKNDPNRNALRKSLGIMEEAAGQTIPAFSKIAYKSSGPLTISDVNAAREAYDNLAGYRGAHKNLDREFGISKVATLNLPKKTGEKKIAAKGQQIRPEQELGVVTPVSRTQRITKTPEGETIFRDQFSRPKSVMDRIKADKKLEPNIILGKDAKQAIAEVTDEEFADAFDRYLNAPDDRRNTLRDDLGPQPEVTESFIDFYNDGKVTDEDFIKSMANYVMAVSPASKEVKGFALGKFVDDVMSGKYKGKNLSQVFSKAKATAKTAKGLQRKEYGESFDYQKDRNIVRKAAQAFYASNGYDASINELSDFINSRYPSYKDKNITPERVEQAQFEEVAAPTELGGVQGDARDIAQTRIARDAGLDQLTDAIVGPRLAGKIDSAVGRILEQAPVKESVGKFTKQAPRRGAKYDTKGDPIAKALSKSNTQLDKDIFSGISDLVSTSALKENFGTLKDLFNLPQNSFDDMSKAERQNLKRKVVKGLAAEAEQRLGKQTTPSQELDFSIEEGSATRDTDLGVRSKLQVNSHRQPWNETAKELNNTIRKTDFSKDWVQWSPGQLGNISRGRAKGIPMHVLRELNKQPARVAKLVSKHGLETRKDTKNPGVYHIYKPGEIGSKPDFSIEEKRASTTRPTMEYRKAVGDALKKAWGTNRVYDQPSQWNAKVYGLKLSGVQMPFDRVKGLMHAGAVYLNPSAMTKDTPIHEFAHIWAKELMRNNPKLWKRGKDLLKGSDYARAVYDIPTYRKYLKDNPARFWEEVMANAIGKRGAVLFENRQKANAWDKWMGAMTKWLKNKLGISAEKDYMDLTLDDWLDVGVHGVFTGKAPKLSKAIEYSIAREQAAKVAKQGPKKGWFKKATDWMVGPAADDYHGLAQRFSQKFGKDPINKKFKEMTKKYVDGYEQYEKDATKARENFKKQGAALAKALGIKPGKLDNELAKDSEVTFAGAPLSYQQALEIYTNPEQYDPGLVDQISNTLPPAMLKFADNLGFSVQGSVQASLLNHINKNVFKDSMSDFLEYKNKNFTEDVLNDLGSKMGKEYQDAIEDSLNRMGGASGRPTDAITQKWNDWLNNSVGAIMFLNVRSAALQSLSIWNYMSPGNMFTFNRDLGQIISNPSSDQRKMFQELWNDPMLKERRARAGFDVNANEILDAARSGSMGKLTQKALNKGFILTSAMDSFAIAAGGAAFVRQEMRAGKSKEQALRAWREKTQEAQQSARPDRVSKQQKAGVSKFILAFANTPAQYFRLSQKAYRTIKAKGLTSPEGMAAARKIAYYMAIQNAIFTMAQSASTSLFTGWGGEDDEQKEAENALNSMISTGLRGMGLYGAVLSAAKDAVLNASRESGKKNPKYSDAIIKGALQVSPPLNRKINQIQGIGRAYTYKQERSKTGLRSPHAVAIGKGGEALFNLPTDWTQKKLAAFQALYEGDANLEEFLWMLGGYSEYSVLGKGKDEFDIGDLDIDLDDIDIDDIDF